MFREDKATAAAAFFLSKAENAALNDLILMKLLYVSERESLRDFTASITDDRFVSLSKGPILSHTYDLMKGEVMGTMWHKHIKLLRYRKDGVSENTVTLTSPVEVARYLSRAELKLLERVWDEHKDFSKWELVELTHEFPEWDPRARKDQTSIPITEEAIFRKGFKEDAKTATDRAAEVKFYRELA